MEARRLSDLNIRPGVPFILRRSTGDIDIQLGGKLVRGECAATTVLPDVLNDSDGTLCEGALGVLIDEATGFAAVHADSAGRWGASSDIALELFAPLRAGMRVHAHARTPWILGDQSYSECTVTDDSGRTVAHATQRSRFNDEASIEGEEPVAVGNASNALELFGIAEGEAAAAAAGGSPTAGAGPGPADAAAASRATLPSAHLSLVVGGHAQNPQGNLHGGVSIVASLLAAKRALALRGNAGLAATSIRIAYARAATAGQRVEYTAQMLYGGRSLAVLKVVGTADGKPRTIAQVTAHPFAD